MAVLAFACETPDKQGEKDEISKKSSQAKNLSVKYAENFIINQYPGFTLIKVSNAWKNSQKTFTYGLVEKGKELPDSIRVDQEIKVPLDNIVCFSTTHIPYLDMLGVADKLKGFPNLDYISTPGVRKYIEEGKVEDLGSENNPNLEKIITLNPDLVMAYGMPGGGDLVFKLQQAGIPVVYNADYMELSPLGRAEWIKFMAAFFNKMSMADSVYNQVSERYDSLKSLANRESNQPTVISGIIYGDTWFLPAGKNYAAHFFGDGNAQYFWEDNNETGYLELSFESVYAKAHQADYWVGVGQYNTLQELANADERYKNFAAFQAGNVYSYMARVGPKGGNEYFELGYARPDIILADLIKIFHPQQLPDHQLYFHKQLQ